MSAYLVAFGIGPFQWITDSSAAGTRIVTIFPRCIYSFYPSFTGYNASDFQFASSIAKRSLDFFQSYLTPSYPLSHLQLLLSPNFAAGAMENYGLLIFRGEYLQISEGSNTDQQRRVAYVVAHEIAHQWFGDAVTTADWSDVFIQEGFATMYGYSFKR